MKERPIIFNDEMVRAILDGRKTQTRRVVPGWQTPKQKGDREWIAVAQRHPRYGFVVAGESEKGCAANLSLHGVCPYGKPGDRLWVRETFQGPIWDEDNLYPDNGYSPEFCVYRADGGAYPEYIDVDDNLRFGWKPSIHMPRWASRITLEITNVRVERVQDISEEDGSAEGIFFDPHAPVDKMGLSSLYRIAYRDLWQSIYGPDSWADNPWVWVIEFRRV